MSRIIVTEKAPAAIGPYSQALVSGKLLFTSGQIPLDPRTGEVSGTTVAEQTRQVMNNLRAVLEAAGTSFERVIKTTCFLVNMDDFSVFNGIYAEYFVNKPARSCVAVKALPRNVLVEIELVAETD
ncbi:MAG: RidA family protein [Spirochaetaceae bacterium]|jgi:2-iminobutanoate/2-iminopropanoate deaminase|nr:RidA family protein [Spirochaetaceae bacterium]